MAEAPSTPPHVTSAPPRAPPLVFGPEALPGSYTLRLAFAGDTTEALVEARFDQRDESSTADRRAKFEARMRAGRHLETLAEAVERTNRLFAEEVSDFRESVRAADLEFFPEKEPIEAGVPE